MIAPFAVDLEIARRIALLTEAQSFGECARRLVAGLVVRLQPMQAEPMEGMRQLSRSRAMKPKERSPSKRAR